MSEDVEPANASDYPVRSCSLFCAFSHCSVSWSPSFHLYSTCPLAATSLQAPSLGISLSLGHLVLPILHDLGGTSALTGYFCGGNRQIIFPYQVSFYKIWLIVLPPRAAGTKAGWASCNPFSSELGLVQVKNNFVVQRPILYGGVMTRISLRAKISLSM